MSKRVIVRKVNRRRRMHSKRDYTHRVSRMEARRVVRRELETKTFDGYIQDGSVASQITALGQNFLLTDDWSTGLGVPMIQGVGLHNYIGQKIMPIAFKMRYAVTVATGMTGDFHNTVSIMLIQAKGLFLPAAGVGNQYQLTNDVSAPFSAVNTAFNDRYRILARHVVDVNEDTPSVSGVITIKGKKLRHIQFSDAAGTTEANPLFMAVVSDSTVGTHPTLRAYWRIYYKDA